MEKTLMILNRKKTQNNTNSTTDRQSLMLRMVTSYSIFLLVILILFLYLYQSTFRNVQQQYDFQQESTMVSNVELFEKDLKIMDIYCRQLLQNNTFRKLIAFHDSDNERQSRSEEHTSELQSPITISYAVFCLKKIFF